MMAFYPFLWSFWKLTPTRGRNAYFEHHRQDTGLTVTGSTPSLNRASSPVESSAFATPEHLQSDFFTARCARAMRAKAATSAQSHTPSRATASMML